MKNWLRHYLENFTSIRRVLTELEADHWKTSLKLYGNLKQKYKHNYVHYAHEIYSVFNWVAEAAFPVFFFWLPRNKLILEKPFETSHVTPLSKIC